MRELVNHALVLAADVNHRARLARLLHSAGVKLELTSTWECALKLASKQRFDIAFVVPSGPVSQIRLEELQSHVLKIVFLARTSKEIDGLRDFSSPNADLPMSASDEELFDLIRKVLTPCKSANTLATVSIGDCRISFDTQSFILPDGSEISLTLAETILMKELAREPRQVRSRDELRQAIAGRGIDRFDRSIDMLVARIRQKIEPNPKVPRFIITVPTRGYSLARNFDDPAKRTFGSKPLDAQRRQLTVLSCNIAHWATLAFNRDPEDLSDISQQFRAAAESVIATMGGTIFSRKPEGLLAYFCYPESTEHDAECAIRAAVSLLERIGSVQPSLTTELELKIGIATGLAVVNASEAVGEPLEAAVALGDAAAPNSVLVDATTQKLTEGRFGFEPLHETRMPRLPMDTCVFQVLAPDANRARAPASLERRASIGRERDLKQLLRFWERAKHWHGQVVIITGDPGIGKSHLCEAFIERISEDPHNLVRYECSFLLRNNPLHPIVTQIEQEVGFNREDTPNKVTKLRTALFRNNSLTSDELLSFADLLSFDVITESQHKASTAQKRDRLIARLAQLIAEPAIDLPLVVVLADAQWADSSTLHFIDEFVQTIRTKRILLIVQCRPEYAPAWLGAPHVNMLSIDRLGRDESLALLSTIPGADTLSDTMKDQILRRSDGVPLFIEEITKSALEIALDRDSQEEYQSRSTLKSEFEVPPTLLGSLTARLDRLGQAKEIAQIAAAVGQESSYELLKQVAGLSNEVLDDGLRRLEASGLMYRRGAIPNAIYTFKHVLLRDAAYSTVLKRRRRQLHASIASALSTHIAERTLTKPELIAHHHSEAGNHREALDFWRDAAKLAARRSAHKESLAHLNEAFKELALLDDTDARHKAELGLQTMLGNSLRIEGWAGEKVKGAYSRAMQLCNRDTPNRDVFGPIFGLWAWHFVRSLLPEAQEFAERLMSLASSIKSPEYEVLGRQALGFTFFAQGRFQTADVELDRCIALCDDQHDFTYHSLSGQDPRVHARLYRAMVLWFLGLPDRASTLADEAAHYARSFEDPFSEAMAQTIGLRIRQLRGEADIVAAQADAAIALCTQYGFTHYRAMTLIVRGWARTMQGEFADGIADLLEGLRIERANGALIFETYALGLLGDACIKSGRYEQALGFLQAAAQIVEKDHSACFYAAEIHRLLGEARFRLTGNAGAAEQFISEGLALARKQKAKSLELKLCVTACEIYRDTAEYHAFSSSLRELFDTFQEGHDTSGLIRAKAMLGLGARSDERKTKRSTRSVRKIRDSGDEAA